MRLSNIQVIKIGGPFIDSRIRLESFFAELAEHYREFPTVLIHGGGRALSAFSERLGLKPHFKQGIRMTSASEMDLVDMVLGGKINSELVRKAAHSGIRAVGICGSDASFFTGESTDPQNGSRTGKVRTVNTEIIDYLLEGAYMPIVCSTSMDAEGGALNINADQAALSVSSALQADVLLLISDTAGIMKEGRCIQDISCSDLEEEIENGTITEGMIPKVRSAARAIEQGVGKVVIGTYQKKGDLTSLRRAVSGTLIYPAK